MRATGRYGESCSFHSTDASSIGIVRLSVWNWIMKSKVASECASRLAARRAGRCRSAAAAGSCVRVGLRPRDVLDGTTGAEQVRRRAPVGDVEVAGRILPGRQRRRASHSDGTGSRARASAPPASTACSSSQEFAGAWRHHHRVAVQDEVLRRLAGRQVVAGQPERTLMDMPRTSFSRSVADEALANRMKAG